MPRTKRKPTRVRRRRSAQPGGQLSALLPLIKPLLRPALKFIGPIIAGELLKSGIQRAVRPKKGKGLHVAGRGLKLAGQRGRGAHKLRPRPRARLVFTPAMIKKLNRLTLK